MTCYRNFYASNVNPLWTKSFPINVDAKQREERMHRYLKVGMYFWNNVDNVVAGFPRCFFMVPKEERHKSQLPNATEAGGM